MNIGRRVYYELSTGFVILDTGERMGFVPRTTVADDIESYKVLQERNMETVGVLELEFGDFAEDFSLCSGFRVNVETKELEFNYAKHDDTNEDTEPIFIKPLSQQVSELELKNILLEAQNKVLSDRTDFHEEVLTEIIMTIHS